MYAFFLAVLNLTVFQERDGWYSSSQLERVKVVLRHKFFSLLESHVATDEECQKILDAMPESRGAMHGPTYSRSRRTRKHNKAKGALPPEEEAVCPQLSLQTLVTLYLHRILGCSSPQGFSSGKRKGEGIGWLIVVLKQ